MPLLYFFIAIIVVQHKLYKKEKIYQSGRRKLNKAIENNHIIHAELDRVSHIGRKEKSYNYNEYKAIYKYVVNGKIYRKCIKQTGKHAEKKLTLYYTKYPIFAKTEGEFLMWSEQILLLLLPLLLTVTFASIIGLHKVWPSLNN